MENKWEVKITAGNIFQVFHKEGSFDNNNSNVIKYIRSLTNIEIPQIMVGCIRKCHKRGTTDIILLTNSIASYEDNIKFYNILKDSKFSPLNVINISLYLIESKSTCIYNICELKCESDMIISKVNNIKFEIVDHDILINSEMVLLELPGKTLDLYYRVSLQYNNYEELKVFDPIPIREVKDKNLVFNINDTDNNININLEEQFGFKYKALPSISGTGYNVRFLNKRTDTELSYTFTYNGVDIILNSKLESNTKVGMKFSLLDDKSNIQAGEVTRLFNTGGGGSALSPTYSYFINFGIVDTNSISAVTYDPNIKEAGVKLSEENGLTFSYDTNDTILSNITTMKINRHSIINIPNPFYINIDNNSGKTIKLPQNAVNWYSKQTTNVLSNKQSLIISSIGWTVVGSGVPTPSPT